MMKKTMTISAIALATIMASNSGFSNSAIAQDERPPLDARTLADYVPEPYVKLQNPEWSRKAVLYQVNTRQFTPEGTFKAAQKQLPRLKALGVDIVWLMPIHPIGEKNRKGGLGSPYSVKDYTAVNPEFGSEQDLRDFIDAAHDMGMKVILDWVANHTAWDNAWVTEHPEWYERDWKGDFHPTPWWDWSDIIDLDYNQPGVRKAMTEALVYWVREFDIDGYRADVAGYVPTDFWEKARADMEAVKPVFMLGEWQARDLHARAFDATYSWDWYSTMENVAHGKGNATSFYGYYSADESAWPHAAMRMTFTENHDKNAWEGTQYEAFGDYLPAAIALSFVGDGIALIHNGQEACNSRRLKFFDRDPITWPKNNAEWNNCALDDLFKNLIAFRKANSALDNGRWGANMVKVENDQPEAVLSFIRQNDENRVFAAFNFTDKPVSVKLTTDLQAGEYKIFQTRNNLTLSKYSVLKLGAGEFILAAQ